MSDQPSLFGPESRGDHDASERERMSRATDPDIAGVPGSDRVAASGAPNPADDHDLAARTYATDPRHNVVLEASAGTGKTSVLVARYVNLLRTGVDPANILAITFTRKAAAEMRERIVRELRREAARQAFDRDRWAAIRDRLADIQISTIDAFCLSLLREFPLEADLDPGFSMADETEVPRIIDEALDQTLAICVGRAKTEPDLALVLAQLGLSRTREGLAHLLERRLVARGVLDRFVARGPVDVTAAGICRRFVDGLASVFRSVPGGLESFLADGPGARPRFQLLAQDLRRLETFRHADAAVIRALLKRVDGHFLTQDGKPRTGGAITGYGAADYPSPAAGRRHREAVKHLAPEIQGLVRAFNRDLNVVLARGVRRLFGLAAAQYRRALDDRALLDFSDVLEKAVDLLGRMEEFSQSRYRLEGRYQHVLVDEFQDTSRKQWELVSLLVKAWGEGLGIAGQPSIFIVGDRKQSIYRFRDAEVAMLREAAAFVERLRPGTGKRRSIARSLRSVPGLLAFVNDLFTDIAGARADPDDFTYTDDDRFPVPAGGGETVLGLATGVDPDDCAAVVAAEVRRVLRDETVRDRQTGARRPAAPGDIAILFRSRASHREFERALEAQAVPAYVYKGLGFFDADEIKDLSALIRFLANPASNLRSAALLRSRLVGVSDSALAALAPEIARALTGPVPPAAMQALPPEDRRVFELARASVPSWLARVDRMPPADLIEQLLPETAYAFELRGGRRVQAWENVKKLHGLIRRIQNRGYATLPRIAEYLDALTAGDESNAVLEAVEAVNLMTIHASKGLEFPIVFVVNVSKGASGIPKPIRVSGDEVAIGSLVSEIGEEEKSREHEETKRLLYVGLTRARDRLYLASVLKDGEAKPGRGSLATVLPVSFTAMFGRAAATGEDEIGWASASGIHTFRICRTGRESTPMARGPLSPANAPVDLFNALAESGEVARTPVTAEVSAIESSSTHGREDEALVGTLVHRLLQRWRNDGGPVPETDTAALAASLIRGNEWADAADPSAAVLKAARVWRELSGRPDVVSLLASGERLHEVPFSYARAGERATVLRGAIDCLIKRPDASVLVLELKTGRPSPGHQQQLDVYVAAARVMYPNATVTGHLIYPK